MSDEVCFSVNTYDYEGDVIDRGIFLHFGNTAICVAYDYEGYLEFIEKLKGMAPEISES